MLRPLIFRTLITNFALAGLSLVNSILLSRWLGPDGRGEIAAAMLWPTLLIYLSCMGLITAITYFAALPESKPQAIFANALWLGLVQGAAAILIGFVILPVLLRSQTSAVVSTSRVYLLVIPLSLLTQYGMSTLQGCLHIAAFNWLRLILPAGYLIGTVFLMVAGWLAPLNIILLHLLLNAILMSTTLMTLSKSGVHLSLETDVPLAKRMLKYGTKLQIGGITGLANISLDQVLMAAWLPPSYLGIYVVAVSGAGLAQNFSQAVQMVLTPSITQKESLAERATVLQSAFRRYWLLSFLVTLAIAAMLPIAIPLVFGANFKEAVWPAEILLLGIFFIGAKDVLGGGAQALGDPWLGSKAQLVALFVTVGLLYLLLPRLGIIGAAIATTAAYCTQLMVVAYGLRQSHGIPLKGLFRFKLADLPSALNVLELINLKRAPLASDQS
jgi:O-antigen/teichoic acid export membrane protein